MMLGFGIGMFVSSVSVLFKDFSQVVAIFLQIGFWAIPIFWNPETMSPWVMRILKFNPIYYIVTGCRESFMDKTAFWAHRAYTVYFWVITIILIFIGCRAFTRLRPHFADEL